MKITNIMTVDKFLLFNINNFIVKINLIKYPEFKTPFTVIFDLFPLLGSHLPLLVTPKSPVLGNPGNFSGEHSCSMKARQLGHRSSGPLARARATTGRSHSGS